MSTTRTRSRRRLRSTLLPAVVLAIAVATFMVTRAVDSTEAVLVSEVVSGDNVITAARIPSPQVPPSVGVTGACYTLTWTIPTGDDGVYIYRSNNGGAWTQIAQVPAPTTTYQDCTPGTGASYSTVGYLVGWTAPPPGTGDTGGGGTTTAPVTAPPPLGPPAYMIGTLNCISGSHQCSLGGNGSYWTSNTVRVMSDGTLNCISGSHQCFLGGNGSYWTSNTVRVTP